MFPWFDFFNKLLTTMVRFNRKVVQILDDGSITDRQKVGSIKMLLIGHEDDLLMSYAKVLEEGIFKPIGMGNNERTIIHDSAQGIEVVYSLN